LRSRAEYRDPRSALAILIILCGEVSMSKDHHAQGQKDFVEGVYNPPNNITPVDHLVYDKHTIDEMVKQNEEYDAGYKNAEEQK
jgi:hypothetical protein